MKNQELKQECNHEIVVKFGVAECQNCGMEESEIISSKKKETLEESEKIYSKSDMAEAWVEGYHRKVDELNGGGNLTSFNEWIKQLNNKKQ